VCVFVCVVCVCVCLFSVCMCMCVYIVCMSVIYHLHLIPFIIPCRTEAMHCALVLDFSLVPTWDLITPVCGYTLIWLPQFTV